MQAHGKIILIGEHSVVYGYPAIALPFKTVTVDCKITSADTFTIQSDYASGNLFDYQNEAFFHAIKVALAYLKKPLQNLHFEIKSTIPAQRGLGSSAAVSISIIRTIFAYYQVELPDELLYKLSFEAEKIAHINPSGIDLLVCANEDAYLFSKTLQQRFFFKLDAYLIVIDSGITGKTKTAIEIVKKNHTQKAMEQLGDFCYIMQEAIKNNDLSEMGKTMNAAHSILKSFKIVPQEIDELTTYLQKYTLGAKMSGGGLGGCVIALTQNLEVAQTLQKNLKKKGINNIWIQKI